MGGGLGCRAFLAKGPYKFYIYIYILTIYHAPFVNLHFRLFNVHDGDREGSPFLGKQ